MAFLSHCLKSIVSFRWPIVIEAFSLRSLFYTFLKLLNFLSFIMFFLAFYFVFSCLFCSSNLSSWHYKKTRGVLSLLRWDLLWFLIKCGFFGFWFFCIVYNSFFSLILSRSGILGGNKLFSWLLLSLAKSTLCEMNVNGISKLLIFLLYFSVWFPMAIFFEL